MVRRVHEPHLWLSEPMRRGRGRHGLLSLVLAAYAALSICFRWSWSGDTWHWRIKGHGLTLSPAFASSSSAWLQGIPAVVPGICGPALAMLAGGLAAGRLDISPFGLCSAQHFSAGMILAVSGALMKELAEHGLMAALVLASGFICGVGAMAQAKRFTSSASTEEEGEMQVKTSIPWPAFCAVGIDSLVDGLLLGMIGVETPRAMPMMAGATALEMGALGLTFAASLQHCRQARLLGILGMPLVLALGGCIGALAASPLRSSPLAYMFLVAFGIAALLFLVTQELLPEAREQQERLSSTSSSASGFFLFGGYLFVLLIEVALE